MSPGRIGVIALMVAVIGSAVAAAAFTRDDDGLSTTEALLLTEARQEDAPALHDVAEDDVAGGGPDPTGDGTLGEDGTSNGDNGGANSLDGALTNGTNGTSGSAREDGLRRELVRERAASDALRTQLAKERRDTSESASPGAAPAPAPAPAPSGRWGGGGTSNGGGSYSGGDT